LRGALNREADYIPQLRKTVKCGFCLSRTIRRSAAFRAAICGAAAEGRTVMYIQGPRKLCGQDRTGMQMTVSHGVQIVSLRGGGQRRARKRRWILAALNTSNKRRLMCGAQNDLMHRGAKPSRRVQYRGPGKMAAASLRRGRIGEDWMAWCSGTLTATVVVPTNRASDIDVGGGLQTGRDCRNGRYSPSLSLDREAAAKSEIPATV